MEGFKDIIVGDKAAQVNTEILCAVKGELRKIFDPYNPYNCISIPFTTITQIYLFFVVRVKH